MQKVACACLHACFRSYSRGFSPLLINPIDLYMMRGMVFLKLSVFYLRLSFLQFMLLAPFTRVRWPQLMICFLFLSFSWIDSLPLVTCPCPSTMLGLLLRLQHHLSRYYDTPVLLSLLGFLWLSWDCHGSAMEAVKVWPVCTTALCGGQRQLAGAGSLLLCASALCGGQRQLMGAGSLVLFGFWDSNLDFQAWPQARSPLSQLTDSCFSFKICGISSSIELKWCALVLIQCLLQVNDLIESPCNELRARNSPQCFNVLLQREYSLVT